MAAEVTYVCAAPSHQSREGGPDKITVHAGAWAFCRYDTKADGHEWKLARDSGHSVGGLPARFRDPAEIRR